MPELCVNLLLRLEADALDLIRKARRKFFYQFDTTKSISRSTCISSDGSQRQSAESFCKDAVAIIRKGITLSPHEHKFYSAAADAYETLLDTSSACAYLRYAIHVVSGGAEVRHRLASILSDRARNWLLAGDHSAAIYCLEEATKLKPVDSTLWMLLAIAFVHVGTQEFLTNAILALDHALALKPSCHESYILRGKCNWGLGKRDAGIHDFEKAAHLAPNHPEVVTFDQMMFRKANVLYQSAVRQMKDGHFFEAAEILSQAIYVTPKDTKLLVLRATAFRLVKKFDSAIADLDLASKEYFQAHTNYQDPDNHVGQSNADQEYALLFAMKNVPIRIREPFQVTRQRVLVYNEMALDLIQCKGQYVDALNFLNKAINLEYQLLHGDTMAIPSHKQQRMTQHSARSAVTTRENRRLLTRLLINRGDCYRALNKVEQALADFHEALGYDPSDWDTKTRLSLIHYIVGVNLLNKSCYEEAEIEISVALGFNDKIAAYFVVRGRAFYYQHKFGDSYKDFCEALALDPSNEEAQKAIQQFEPHQGTLREVQRLSSSMQIATLPPITPLGSINPYLAKVEPAQRRARKAAEGVKSLYDTLGSGMPLEKDDQFSDILKRGKMLGKERVHRKKKRNEFGTIWESTADCIRIERKKKETAREARIRVLSKSSANTRKDALNANLKSLGDCKHVNLVRRLTGSCTIASKCMKSDDIFSTTSALQFFEEADAAWEENDMHRGGKIKST